VKFTIPGPPVPKARARVVNGGSFTPQKTRDYEAHVATIALATRSREASWGLFGLYGVTIDVYRRGGRGDADNYAKAVLDACNGVLWKDDGQVRDLHVRVHDVRVCGGDPRVDVRAEVML
jgi:Holliday junction resolvase RusA-like endonuclease